jgi:hypothetical protein
MEMVSKQSSPFMEMVSKQSSPFMELRSQLEIELADLEEIEVELSPAEAKFCSGRHAFRKINTRCGHNSQPAPSQTQKIKNRPGGFGSHLRNYRKWRQKIFTAIT